MKNSYWIIGAIVIVAIGGFALAAFRGPNTSVPGSQQIEVTPAPDFTLEKIGGGTLTLSDYKDKKPVILDFWATWCPNCRRNIPHQQALYEKYKNHIEVVGVDLQEEPSIVEKFVSDFGLTYPVVLDTSGETARKYHVAYTNYHVLVGKNGDIVETIPGDISESDFIKLIAEMKTETRATFDGGRLRTNMSKHSIDLTQVLDGGPGKDGIPALTNPKFTSIGSADRTITDTTDGILITVDTSTKFYPYNILVWHEVVNDVVGGKPLVITFCPLCGSAIVYDAAVDGKTETFGVSGKLYESNLLMYDTMTESLWSQVQGEAVVGDKTGTRLALYPSQVVSFKTVRERYPQAHILSTDTGYHRDYSVYPYGNYGSTDDLYFPVSVTDTRLPAKEILHIVNYNGHSIAFKVKDLQPGVVATVDVAGTKITARIKEGEIKVTTPDGKELPSYTSMWFAWVVYHQKDGIVWTAEKQL
jgi:thiol-disulfide isomerase/thioredoxin